MIVRKCAIIEGRNVYLSSKNSFSFFKKYKLCENIFNSLKKNFDYVFDE